MTPRFHIELVWMFVHAGWHVVAPDATVWRVVWAPGAEWVGQPVVESESGERVTLPVHHLDMAEVVVVPLTAEPTNAARIAATDAAYDAETDQVSCNCVGLSHRNDCPNWVLPF